MLEQVREEQHRFFRHCRPQPGEGRKVAFALLVHLLEPAYVQPLARELRGQPSYLGVAAHPLHLRNQNVRVTQLPRLRK